MEVMRLIWWILLIVVIIIYVRHYFRTPAEVAILQTTLNNFTFEILREKQPLVIQDRVASLDEIRSTWFKHILTTHITLPADQYTLWTQNKHKYLVLHPSTQCEVLLYSNAGPPLTDEGVPPEDATLVAIQLAENQMVVIPYRMYYSVSSPQPVQALGVHDYITRFLPS